MTRTNRERVIGYLRSISPEGATNSEIREATGIEPHQQVFQLTHKLMQAGLIRGVQGAHGGNEWVFWATEPPAIQPPTPSRTSPKPVPAHPAKALASHAFEQLARSVMSMRFGIPLVAGQVPGVPKEFDMISPDKSIVGDAKYFTLVRGEQLPSAKFSNISEHVWLLDKTEAVFAFLVFGNDRHVPVSWLKRYGNLAPDVAFYFLTDDGELEQLAGPVWPGG
jgi:hypothetical protein